MSKTFEVTCSACRGTATFKLSDVPKLQDHLDDEVGSAYAEGRDEGEESDQGVTERRITGTGDRPLWELSAAIQRGDLAEAALQLDRVVAELGMVAAEQVDQARFSYRAKAAA